MVVDLENIHKSYASGFLMRRRPVLRGLSLALRPGDAYGLLGHNGAGKSTTLKILLGLARADQGGGTLLGAPLGNRKARARLGYLPETPTFHDTLTAREFLMFCGGLQGMRGAELVARAMHLLERLDLAGARDLRLRKMSKGMLQRLGLAQALLGDPELLVLDEPMSGLDPQGRKLVRDLVLEQRRAGRTVLFSTHILSDVEIVCTRAGILRDGVIGQELVLGEGAGLGTESVEVHARGLDAAEIVRLGAGAQRVIQNVDGVLFVLPPGPAVHATVAAVLQAGGVLESVVPRRASLEDLYVRTASGAAPDARQGGVAGSASPEPTYVATSHQRRVSEREGVPSC